MIVKLSDIEFRILKRIIGQYIATEAELKGQYGDREVVKDPPKWDAENNGSFVGCRWSDCPPDYLEELAGFFEWKASKDKQLPVDQQRFSQKSGKPFWMYDERDARLMRGWAVANANHDKKLAAKAAAEALPPPERRMGPAMDPDADIPF